MLSLLSVVAVLIVMPGASLLAVLPSITNLCSVLLLSLMGLMSYVYVCTVSHAVRSKQHMYMKVSSRWFKTSGGQSQV